MNYFLKFLRTAFGLTALFVAIHIFIAYYTAITIPGLVNPSFVDSITDKIFWFFLIGGFGGLYLFISLWLLSMRKLPGEIDFMSIGMIISLFLMTIGLYYSFLFGSPW